MGCSGGNTGLAPAAIRFALLVLAAAAAVGSAAPLGVTGTAQATAAGADYGGWVPLQLVPGVRSRVLGSAHPARGRELSEVAYVLDGGVKGPTFDPDASVGVRPITCDEDFCPKAKSTCGDSPSTAACEFGNSYADGDQNGGPFLRDSLLLARPGAAPEVLKDFVFGCAKYLSGPLVHQYADGLVGLSMGPGALPPQLAAAGVGGRGSAPGTFTLCLSRAGGAMALGKPARPPGAASMQYVPLLSSPKGFYLVPLDSIIVAGKPLAIAGDPPKSLLLDSGSTFTYLPTLAYKALVSALNAALAPLQPTTDMRLPRRSLRQVSESMESAVLDYGGVETEQDTGDITGREGPGPAAGSVFVDQDPGDASDSEMCWTLTGPGTAQIMTEYDLAGVFPDLEMSVTGGVTLKLPPYRYAHVVAKTKGNASVKPRASVCLGVFDGNTAAIFGAIMMRDTLLEFDWAGPGTKRVGFAQADCGWLANDFSRGT